MGSNGMTIGGIILTLMLSKKYPVLLVGKAHILIMNNNLTGNLLSTLSVHHIILNPL